MVNICAWVLAGVLPLRRAVGDPALPTRRRQLLLSAPFVFGCAFRSVFPRADVQRICVVDSWLSSVAVGRTVAMIAELCFAAQCALLLRMLAIEDAQSPVALGISRVIVPLIAMAETFSWYSVVTTNYIGNTVEESTWATVSILLIAGLVVVRPRLQGALRAFVGQAIWIIAAYFVFLATIDVPMYFAPLARRHRRGRALPAVRRGNSRRGHALGGDDADRRLALGDAVDVALLQLRRLDQRLADPRRRTRLHLDGHSLTTTGCSADRR